MNADRPRRVHLSDAERLQLEHIEQDLVQQDADFVRGLRRAAGSLPAEPVQPVDLLVIRAAAWCVTSALAVTLLAAGSVAGSLAMCVLALVVRSCCARGTSPHVARGRWRRWRPDGRRPSRRSS